MSLMEGRGLDVVVAGAGLMGRWHARYAAAAGARIAAIVDPDRSAALRLARRHRGAAVFESLEECLERTAGAAVHVCSPTNAHGENLSAAIAAGRHVLVEKPLAPSENETRAFLDAAEAKKLVLTAVHQFPFQRGARRLRRDLAGLGDLVRCEFAICSAGGSDKDDAARRQILLEMLPHPLSLIRSLFAGDGPLSSDWQARTFTSSDLRLSASRGAAEFDIFFSLRGRPTRCELVATGTRATAFLDLFHGFCWIDSAAPSRFTKAGAPLRRGAKLAAGAAANLLRRALSRQPAYPGLPEIIRSFYAAARREAPPPVGREEILESARLADRLRGSREG